MSNLKSRARRVRRQLVRDAKLQASKACCRPFSFSLGISFAAPGTIGPCSLISVGVVFTAWVGFFMLSFSFAAEF